MKNIALGLKESFAEKSSKGRRRGEGGAIDVGEKKIGCAPVGVSPSEIKERRGRSWTKEGAKKVP